MGEMKLNGIKIGVIGGGQMCEAIFSGVTKNGAVSPSQITVTDLNGERLAYLQENYGFATLPNNPGNGGALLLAEQSDLLVLAVKPQFARPILSALQGKSRRDQLVLSIMGGVTIAAIEPFFPENPVIRVMPNTPMLVGKGAAGLAAGTRAMPEHLRLAKELFAQVGRTYLLPENLIDPLTGVSGCGPAFVYMMIEALADGGVAQGLPRAAALELAAQTVAGAAEMVLQTGAHPGALKDSVCSPGGSTIAGVHSLERDSFRGAVMNAVEASCQKMAEVGKKA